MERKLSETSSLTVRQVNGKVVRNIMSNPVDPEFNRRMYETVMPVTERYVRESGRPDRVQALQFDRYSELLDYTQTHLEARPPIFAEKFGRITVEKIVGIPAGVFEETIVPAFEERSDEIIKHRLERPQIQLADHTPNLLPVATQFAGNIALSRHLIGGTKSGRLKGLIEQSHGIGTIGYRALGVRLAPKLPVVGFGTVGRWLTHTHYTIPATPQYRELDWQGDDRRVFNGVFAMNLVSAMTQKPEASVAKSHRHVRPSSLYPECVINPPGTKEGLENGRVVLPEVSPKLGMLIDGLSPDILEVFTAFERDEDGRIISGHCEVGEIIRPNEGQGAKLIDEYMNKQAAFRTQHEDREVVYAAAA